MPTKGYRETYDVVTKLDQDGFKSLLGLFSAEKQTQTDDAVVTNMLIGFIMRGEELSVESGHDVSILGYHDFSTSWDGQDFKSELVSIAARDLMTYFNPTPSLKIKMRELGLEIDWAVCNVASHYLLRRDALFIELQGVQDGDLVALAERYQLDESVIIRYSGVLLGVSFQEGLLLIAYLAAIQRGELSAPEGCLTMYRQEFGIETTGLSHIPFPGRSDTVAR